MATKHTITLTCDACKTEGSDAYSWARISISGSTQSMILMPDQHYDLCPECWRKVRSTMIYPRKAETVE